MRNLQADLALCEAAKPENWTVEESRFCPNKECPHFEKLTIVAWPPNIEFIAAAREGWPAAIRRALADEADMDFLKQEYRDNDEPMTKDALELKARLKILEERDTLRAENERLRKALISIAEETTDEGARGCARDALEVPTDGL